MAQTQSELEKWMASNRLRLNSAKTKFMWLGTRQQLAKLNLLFLSAKFPGFTFSASVRDLGILLDQELTFAPHLHRLTRDCLYQLRQLRTVARSLSRICNHPCTLFRNISNRLLLVSLLWPSFCTPKLP